MPHRSPKPSHSQKHTSSNHSTLLIVVALMGALALYVLVKQKALQVQKKPLARAKTPPAIQHRAASHKPAPTNPKLTGRHAPAQSPFKKPLPLAKRKTSPRTAAALRAVPSRPVQPRQKVTSLRFQQQFRALRKRILAPEAGLIHKKKWLSPRRVQQVLGLQQPLEPIFLQGIPRSEQYDAVQYVLKGKPTSSPYILGLQVWIGSPKALTQRFSKHRQTYPGAKEHPTPSAGQRSFASAQNSIHYLHLRTRTAVLLISCHKAFCPRGKNLITLAQHIARNVP